MSLKTGAVRLVVQGATSPAISADGNTLAYVVEQRSAAGCRQRTVVAVRDLSTAATRLWNLQRRTAAVYVEGLSWSPDGDHLVIAPLDARSGTGILDVHQNVAGGNPRSVATTSAAGQTDRPAYISPIYLADGRLVVVALNPPVPRLPQRRHLFRSNATDAAQLDPHYGPSDGEGLRDCCEPASYH